MAYDILAHILLICRQNSRWHKTYYMRTFNSLCLKDSDMSPICQVSHGIELLTNPLYVTAISDATTIQ